LDIIDLDRWSHAAGGSTPPPVTCASRYRSHARATQRHGHVCAILSPSREIKIFADGVEVFAFRGAEWHLLDLQAKYRVWSDAVGNETLALRLFETPSTWPTCAKAHSSSSSASRTTWRSWLPPAIAWICRARCRQHPTCRPGAICCTCSRDVRPPSS